ncbi:MAG: RluA family pseudouridine synthase [bacterium]
MQGQLLEILVSENKEKERLDTFLSREISRVSRSQIQKFIRDGFVKVNGKEAKANHRVLPFEKIELVIPKPAPLDIIPEDIPLDMLYEDDFLLVVNKPAGMVVHPAFGHYSGTLVHALAAHCSNLSCVNEPYRPGIVHRIDKDTSGVLVVAKDDWVHRELADQFFKKTVIRSYAAVVWGEFNKRSGTIETLLARSVKDRRKIRVTAEGKDAVTHFEVVERLPLTSLIRLRLETGRTHQIRVHLAHIGHPVFGDPTYGGRGRQLGGLNQSQTALAVELLNMMQRQALHAKTLGFIHPKTKKELCFETELPEDMSDLLKRLREAMEEDNV